MCHPVKPNCQNITVLKEISIQLLLPSAVADTLNLASLLTTAPALVVLPDWMRPPCGDP